MTDIGYLGVGAQTTGGPAAARTRMYPVLSSSQEMCVLCDRIDERDRMHFVDSDRDGDPLYVCDAAHGAQ